LKTLQSLHQQEVELPALNPHSPALLHLVRPRFIPSTDIQSVT
jgi:hypothetical protein